VTTTETVAEVAGFLLERLEEDAGRAAAAQAQAAQYADGGSWFRADDLVRALRMEQVDAVMIEVHADPEQVLREVEAKRRFVADYASALSERQAVRDEIGRVLPTDPDAHARLSRQESELTGKAEALLPVLRVVATVYAGHPDYREEWRP